MSDKFEKALQSREEEISKIFAATKMAAPRNLSLPYVKGNQIGYASVEEAIQDHIHDAAVMNAIAVMFQESKCPYVDQFRQSLANRYASQWAEELAMIDTNQY